MNEYQLGTQQLLPAEVNWCFSRKTHTDEANALFLHILRLRKKETMSNILIKSFKANKQLVYSISAAPDYKRIFHKFE